MRQRHLCDPPNRTLMIDINSIETISSINISMIQIQEKVHTKMACP